LPNFFISRLTSPGDLVFDPFMGRGTTLLEAALCGRNAIGNDINPLSRILVEARMAPPGLEAITDRLAEINLSVHQDYDQQLEVFFHAATLKEIFALREYFLRKEQSGAMDDIDRWIRMVAINRLTGHSKGFFSVYTLPPNQATSIERQKKINEKRQQVPEYRDVKSLILKKSKSLLKDALPAAMFHTSSRFLHHDLSKDSLGMEKKIKLSITSPPFLNIVDYKADNWLRCWFAGIDAGSVKITQTPKIEPWMQLVRNTLNEVALATRPGGFFAFEVGEVQNGALRLEEAVVEASKTTPWSAQFILINQQDFTKTSNAWGVKNNAKGTNTNRIVLFSLPA